MSEIVYLVMLAWVCWVLFEVVKSQDNFVGRQHSAMMWAVLILLFVWFRIIFLAIKAVVAMHNCG